MSLSTHLKYILASCDGKKSIDDIISEMSNMYPDVERENCRGCLFNAKIF
ncbi:PqqD family peptide modification chaperone [Enterococcus faecalis]|nr:PqqD family peptide modification chaperone [Enterococcus gallinarum]MBF0822451.1 PqqD family peptide modification chaperone [Enterococcus faecalis]MBF0796665.1 PqqD family peptide modification chaperone [Enterococcus gallinarum]MBX8977540.1 PqqD family peptide modification chaperone [Enterococcus gallinarum]NYS80965.1 PqqD family peptide modification chaperone [Enterococcus gallinarum]